jgi:methionyl-tRNA synthetase
MNKSTGKFYITTPIYYVNDKPHIGHAYTTIAADVVARYYRNKGYDTFFLTGTDEHGAKIAQAAEKAGKSPQAFADEISALFSFAWDQLGVAPDDFIRTTEKRHEDAVVIFLNKLKESGKVYEGDYEGLYCVGHEAFLTEKDLVDGLCPDHKTKPELIKEKNWFFKLSEYAAELKSKIESNEFVIQPDAKRNEVLSFIEQGLEDIAISRPNVSWGIPLPWDPEQTVYVWVEALFNYCSAIGYGSDGEKFKRYWPADVQFMAKDIIKFHCIIWPALLSAVNEKWPQQVFAHGFFTIDGQKMSKSIGNVINPTDWAAKYGSDVVRYFLLREVPFGQDGDVSEEKLRARYDGDLANGLGNLVSRVTNLVEKYLDGKYESQKNFFLSSSAWPKEVDDLIAQYRFHEALQKIWEQVFAANKFVDEKKLWEVAKTDVKELSDACHHLIIQIDLIAQKLAPFMPETSKKIIDHLSQEKVTKIEPLFPRIEA